MLINDLKFFIQGKKAASIYYLNCNSKSGKILATTEQIEMATRYAYEAFKPMLDDKKISRKEFFTDKEISKEYRKLFAKTLSTMKNNSQAFEKEYPNWFKEESDVDIEEFAFLLNRINQQWIELQKNITVNKAGEETNKVIKEKVTYLNFFISPENQRKMLIRIARDENRKEDKEIFQTLEKYITTKEGVDYLEYMDSPELRGLYRKKYFSLLNSLSQEDAKFRNPEESAPDTLRRICSSWKDTAKEAKAISEEVFQQFCSNYGIEKFAQMSAIEISEVNIEILRLRSNIEKYQGKRITKETVFEESNSSSRVAISKRTQANTSSTTQQRKDNTFHESLQEAMSRNSEATTELPRKK